MVKRLLRWTVAAAAVGFAAFAYLYLSLPDVRHLRKENPADDGLHGASGPGGR